MSIISEYKKRLAKQEGINMELLPPSYFLDTGNYALNKLLSGNFEGGLPQGRLVMFAGHSSSGKSLVAASALASVIHNGGYGFAVDSETSLDEDFMRNCGVPVESDNYQYIGVDGIPQATAEVNKILQLYRESGETTRGLIVVDSLDMLLTETEQKRLDTKGDIGGDQGQQAKQLKATLKTWVHSISGLPVTIICTKQPYVEQDPIKAMEEPWKITESWKFAFSQIITLDKLQLKSLENGKKVHSGFTLKARTYKNRHWREKQVVKIEIPFDNGVDPFSGLIEIAEEFGIISRNGGWYTPVLFEGKKFQQKAAEADLDFMNLLLEEIKKVNEKGLEVNAVLDDYVTESDTLAGTPLQQKRKLSAAKKKKKLEDADDSVEE